jgi:hypothetical protein
MGKIDKLKEGDLVVRRGNKKPYIVLAIRKYERKVYGAGPSGSNRKRFLLLCPDGKQKWWKDTALKVEYYLPGDPWFDDIR